MRISLSFHVGSACLAAALILAASPASAQIEQQTERCTNDGHRYQPDVVIKACSALIFLLKSRGVTGDDAKDIEAETLTYRGDAYGDKKDYDHAIADYTQAIADYKAIKHPKAANVDYLYRARGVIYLLFKENYDQAISDANEAIKLNSEDARAYALRGLAYEGKGDEDRALTDFDQAIALNPKDAMLLSERASAYLRKSEPDRAIADLNTAIALEPTNASFLTTRCRANALSGDFSKALADCDKAIALDPDSASAYYTRGLVKRIDGDTAGGDKDVAHAQSIDPQIGK